MSITLRPDQVEAIDAATAAVGRYQRFLLQKPTGTGKTVVFTEMTRQYVADGQRVLILVDALELVDQTVDTMRRAMPGVHIGVVQGGRHHAQAQVVVATVQTVRKAFRRKSLGRFAKIIIDEAHMAAAQSYIDVVHDLGGFDPATGVTVIGLTATADRADDLLLGDMFEACVYNQPVAEAFALGCLVRPEIRRIDVGTRDPHVRARRVLDELGDVQGAYFARDVAEAHAVRDALRAVGSTAEVVHEKISATERARIYRITREGTNRWLVNVNVLVKGFDMPQLEATVFGRRMRQVAYVQAGGRSLRTHPGKTRAVWLDFEGHTHDLQVTPNLARSLDGKREAARTHGARVKTPVITYRITQHRTWLRRPYVIVERVQRDGTQHVARIGGYAVHELHARAARVIREDQERRMNVLRERAHVLRETLRART